MEPVRFFSRLLIIVHVVLTRATSSLINITLGGLISLPSAETVWDGWASLKAAELALIHVNNRPDILPNYRLNVDVKNSKCRAGDGMKGFVDLISQDPTKLLIVGGTCSIVSQPVAGASQHWNLVQMSFTSTSDALSSKTRFPYFFRTSPAQSGLNQPRLAIMKEYGWNRVAIIHEASDVYIGAMNRFSEELSANNLTLLTKESFQTGEKPTAQLQNIKRKDGRIIVVSAYEGGYKDVFCQAYHLDMYGPKFAWIIDSWNTFDWWKNVTGLDCTHAQMYTVVNNYIGTVFVSLRTDNVSTVSGLSASEYQEAYRAYTQDEPYGGEDLAPFGYDAIWAVALALHAVSRQLTADNSSINIEDFDYDNTYHLRERIMQALADLEFEGVTGFVSFDESGDRLASFRIEQLIEGVEEFSGLYLQEKGLQWTKRLVFTGGVPPQDGPVRETVQYGIEASTFVIFTTFAVLGMVTTIVFLIINVMFRKKRLIKMSCPNVNNVIAVGCFMCYVDVIISGINQYFIHELAADSLCLARVWILPIAFSLAFGGLFVKTWRVHIIFRNKTKKTKIVDWHLFVIIGVVVAVDVIIVSVWTATDSIHLVQHSLPDLVDTESDRIIAQNVKMCDSPNSPTFVWTGVIFTWKGILLMYGAFLAWETRKVTMPQLNDSKYIAVAIYNVAVPSIITAPLIFWIKSDHPDVPFILASSCVIFGTTITNSLIFIPKILALYKENKGSSPDGNFSCRNEVSPAQVEISSVSEGLTVRETERQIVKLKHQLKMKEAKIEGLKEIIRNADVQSFSDERL